MVISKGNHKNGEVLQFYKVNGNYVYELVSKYLKIKC